VQLNNISVGAIEILAPQIPEIFKTDNLMAGYLTLKKSFSVKSDNKPIEHSQSCWRGKKKKVDFFLYYWNNLTSA
jgi:hypothetical protein